MRISMCLLLTFALSASAQENKDFKSGSDAKLSSKERFHRLTFTTSAYRAEALRLLLEEANRVAQELQLPEKLPITEADLVEMYITPSGMAQGLKAIGNVSTHRYTYYVSVGNKFSFLVKRFGDIANRDYDQLKNEYFWPISREDTNAAYQLATQWLKASSMDVTGLNKDCRLDIRTYTPEGHSGGHFVPLYWVVWLKGNDPVASVELFEPTKSLRQLRVEKSEYILRKPLQIPEPNSVSTGAKR